MLNVANLQAYSGKSHVLHGVDLSVERGEIVSLLGRNGVGRSTTTAPFGRGLRDAAFAQHAAARRNEIRT